MEHKDLEENKIWPPAPQIPPGSRAVGQNPVKSPQVTTAKDLREARLLGLVIFVLSSGAALWYRADVASEGRISEKILIALPVGIIGGLAFMIEPRIALAGIKGAPSQPALFKILGYATGAVGIGIGLYIRYTFFK